jgi:hypothetical protein
MSGSESKLSLSLLRLKQLREGPNVVADSRLEGGSYSERLMQATQIEKGHVQINRCFQLVKRLAESEAQAREATQMSPSAKVGSLYMAGADMARILVPAEWDKGSSLSNAELEHLPMADANGLTA